MRIKDFQSGKELTDVGIMLTEDELRDLAIYVQKLDHDPHVPCAYLTEFAGHCPISELTVQVDTRCLGLAS